MITWQVVIIERVWNDQIFSLLMKNEMPIVAATMPMMVIKWSISRAIGVLPESTRDVK